jgi:hypothetical protein
MDAVASHLPKYFSDYFCVARLVVNGSSAVLTLPNQRRFLKHLSDEFDAMTNFLVSTSLFTLLPRPYFYDVENVLLIQHSFKRPCEDSSTKRVLNFTLSTASPQLRA